MMSSAQTAIRFVIRLKGRIEVFIGGNLFYGILSCLNLVPNLV